MGHFVKLCKLYYFIPIEVAGVWKSGAFCSPPPGSLLSLFIYFSSWINVSVSLEAVVCFPLSSYSAFDPCH